MVAERARPLVVVLCKPPGSADCKTRLAAGIGRVAAAEVYRACLSTALRSAVACDAEVRLAVAGRPTALASFAWRHAPEADLVRQVGASFAERQLHEFARGLLDGYRPVALVASDLAEPSDEQLRWALRTAASGAVAIVPSPDGGYAVLASAVATPELASVPMSTGRTLESLCETLTRAGRDVAVSDHPLSDIDTQADLDRVSRAPSGTRR